MAEAGCLGALTLTTKVVCLSSSHPSCNAALTRPAPPISRVYPGPVPHFVSTQPPKSDASQQAATNKTIATASCSTGPNQLPLLTFLSFSNCRTVVSLSSCGRGVILSASGSAATGLCRSFGLIGNSSLPLRKFRATSPISRSLTAALCDQSKQSSGALRFGPTSLARHHTAAGVIEYRQYGGEIEESRPAGAAHRWHFL